MKCIECGHLFDRAIDYSEHTDPTGFRSDLWYCRKCKTLTEIVRSYGISGNGCDPITDAEIAMARSAAFAAGHDPDEVVVTTEVDENGKRLEHPIWWSFLPIPHVLSD